MPNGRRSAGGWELDGLARRRMRTQALWDPAFDEPAAALGWLGAVQAQEFAFAKWSIAQRTTGTNATSMATTFDEGAIVRTHVLRPTWHFALAVDVRWLLAATAPRVHQLNRHYYGRVGLDAATVRRAHSAIAKALAGGHHRTRSELARVLDGAGLDTSGMRLGYVLMWAELDGLVVSGALKGKQQTYALMDERVPAAPPMDRDAAIVELTRRFFRSRGPATVRDLARWSSLTLTECRAALEVVRSQFEHQEADGRVYWFDATVPGPRRRVRPRMDLVQGYDEIVMSYSESRDVVAPRPEPPAPIYRDGRMFLHAILLDGQAVGRWRHDPPGDSVAVEVMLDRTLSDQEGAALEEAVERYGRYLGVPVEHVLRS